jgi:hypothetical protein
LPGRYFLRVPPLLLNVAFTVVSAFTVSVQEVVVPLQAPLQPAKLVRDPGVAVRVTVVAVPDA